MVERTSDPKSAYFPTETICERKQQPQTLKSRLVCFSTSNHNDLESSEQPNILMFI
jgi:hypothetical protein